MYWGVQKLTYYIFVIYSYSLFVLFKFASQQSGLHEWQQTQLAHEQKSLLFFETNKQKYFCSLMIGDVGLSLLSTGTFSIKSNVSNPSITNSLLFECPHTRIHTTELYLPCPKTV